jgi:hypothetical protein
MPFKSKAQVRKWGQLVKEGKIKESTYKEALSATKDFGKLPERVGSKTNKIQKVKVIK